MTDRIAEAARATRKYARCLDGPTPSIIKTETMEYTSFETEDDAQAACDRLNLFAVLEALREPSEGMLKAAPASDLKTKFGALYVWRAMIDALIAEVRKSDERI